MTPTAKITFTAYLVAFFLQMTATQHKSVATALMLTTLLIYVIVIFRERPKRKPKEEEPLELITNRR